jgi:hypothetical protein
MDIQDLKIKNIEPIEQINPTGGSGTGYCQYTKIKVTYENDETQIINIANWYTHEKEQIEEFKNALNITTETLGITPENIGAMSNMELLWKNASPNSSFNAQTLNINTNGYSYFIIHYKL